MVTLDKAIVARIQKAGKHFEILVDPELAYDLKSGKQISINRMLAVGQIFSDARKGDRSSPNDIHRAFGTTDIGKIAEEIVKHGDVQLTTDFRRRKVEEKRKLIASLIARQSVDPRTKLPHPQDRILNAMEQVHCNIDPFISAEQQLETVVKMIKSVLPLSIEEAELVVEIPIKYANRAQQIIRQYGTASESWSSEAFVAKIKIPAGMKEKFFSAINGVTEGNVRISEKK